jgi:acetolactate synthase-1/2/3 large subunit
VRLSGAEIVARILIEQGATTVFGYPGGAVLPIYDALYEHRGEIHHYLTAHEQGAAHAADGFARATGRVGVVLATSGPGSSNLVTGIAAAFMDSVPLVAITGNVATPYIGKDSFQEVYTTGITLPITKHNFFVSEVCELAQTLRLAFAIASQGRKGPVLVDITKDAQADECTFEPASRPEQGKGSAKATQAKDVPGVGGVAKSDALAEDLRVVQDALAKSERPLVCFGGGVISADASEALRAVLAAGDLPAAHSLMGIGALDPDDPLNLGLLGMHGRLSANRALKAADLILTLGFRFSDRDVLNEDAWHSRRIIQVDIDPSEADKNVEVTRTVIADVRCFLERLTEQLEGAGKASLPRRRAWFEQIAAWQRDEYRPADDESVLKPHQLIEAIAELAGSDAIITTDVGQHQMWAAQYARRARPRSFLTSGGLGAMGFGYGAAIGAQIGCGGGEKRERPVVHITGDGSFAMNLTEACTAVSYHLPIITVILDNRALGMVRQMQRVFYDARYSATTLERATDFVKLAEGFGLVGMRADDLATFRAAFSKALRIDGPVWIECAIGRDEEVWPMIPAGASVDEALVD